VHVDVWLHDLRGRNCFTKQGSSGRIARKWDGGMWTGVQRLSSVNIVIISWIP
jgi:hypothetical protein